MIGDVDQVLLLIHPYKEHKRAQKTNNKRSVLTFRKWSLLGKKNNTCQNNFKKLDDDWSWKKTEEIPSGRMVSGALYSSYNVIGENTVLFYGQMEAVQNTP